MLSSSTKSESETEEQESTRPTAETTSSEIANISQQHAALLRQAVFNNVPGKSWSEGEQQPKLPL